MDSYIECMSAMCVSLASCMSALQYSESSSREESRRAKMSVSTSSVNTMSEIL